MLAAPAGDGLGQDRECQAHYCWQLGPAAAVTVVVATVTAVSASIIKQNKPVSREPDCRLDRRSRDHQTGHMIHGH